MGELTTPEARFLARRIRNGTTCEVPEESLAAIITEQMGAWRHTLEVAEDRIKALELRGGRLREALRVLVDESFRPRSLGCGFCAGERDDHHDDCPVGKAEAVLASKGPK